MGYYDGNTVTALWNYAQHFALSDNSWTTTFGPSTPGALNLISGQSNGFDAYTNVVDLMATCSTAPTRPTTATATLPRSAMAILCLTYVPTPASIRLRCMAPMLVTCSTPRISPGARSWAGSTSRLRIPMAPPAVNVRARRRRRAARPSHLGRLHPAPCLVPVLCIDEQQIPRPSGLGGGHRPYPRPAHRGGRSGQP